MDCIILGDSIAVGISQFRTDCQIEARVGISAAVFPVGPREARTVLISLGTNDGSDPTSYLMNLRRNIKAEKVIWVIPTRHQNAVRAIAAQWGDHTMSMVRVGPDGVHPDAVGYRKMSEF